MIARLFIAAVFLFYAQFVFPKERILFYAIIAVGSCLSVIYVLWLLSAKQLQMLAWFQIVCDLLLESALVGYTGGADSLFATIYILSILSALEIVGKTAGNRLIEDVITEVHNSIKEGESISAPLGKKKIFPPMVVRMIAVGEETGELDKMLSKIADFYDVQVDTAVDGLTSMIEPLVIAFLGIVIGGIVIAMFLPILTLTQALK